MRSGAPYPIVRHPAPGTRTPILVSVPHYGTEPLPHVTREDYGEPRFETFAYGFADTFVGDLYGDLHEQGATVLATPYSRMFVDVNRRRDDFEQHDGEVRSRRGVVRTHTMRDVPIFARPLRLADLEERLQALYDPYYATLERLLGEIQDAFGYAMLLDGHTGSPRGMKDHEVIIGTRHDRTCDRELAATVARIFTRHDFLPWGVDGGRDGSANEITVSPADGSESVTGCALSRHPLRTGDVVRIATGTGGGWGDPLLRESELVAHDVRNGFVTIDEARDVYGAIVDPRSFTVAAFTAARLTPGS